jgi:DNA-binding SARP family transcriptional activator
VPTDDRVLFGLLGPMLVSMAGAPIALGTPKQRAALALMLINRNRAVSMDALIGALWGEAPVPGARATVHVYVSNLRRLFAAGGRDAHALLASAPPGYRLAVADGACDLDRFISAKTSGLAAAAAGRFDEASAHLSAALAEWRGPALDDVVDFAFVEAFATALTEDALLVQTVRAESEIACGRGYAVIAELEALVAEQPYREPLWAQLMTACYVSDRQSDALAAYRRLQALLAEDLGIDPSPAVAELHERMLRQERLDTAATAKTTAASAIATSHSAYAAVLTVAGLRDRAGRFHVLTTAATRIGRHPDNDVVLGDDEVSRHHAVVVDTGGSFVITDLRSANGVYVQRQRIRPSVTLADGDSVRIGGHTLTFHVEPP